MSGYFDAIDYVLGLAKVLGSYQSMTEEEGVPRTLGEKKEISRSSKLGKKDTRTLTKQQLAFARLEPHLQRNLGEHVLDRFTNYTQNGFFFLKTMNSFPDFTKSAVEEAVKDDTIEDALWNTLLAPQIALVLAECVKVSEALRIKQEVPTSTFEVLAQLIADWQPGLYKDGKHGKVIIKAYCNLADKVQTPEFVAAVNKRGIKGTGYRTIKEHIEILEAELRLSGSNHVEKTLTRVASCYYASVIMYRLETMTNGEKRLDTIKSYLDDAMYLQEKGLAGIKTLAFAPEHIREKPYLIRNLDLFRNLAYQNPDQTALDIFAATSDPESYGTPIQQFAQDRLIEFYSEIGMDIRNWMSIIWPQNGSAIWPDMNSPLPGNKDMKKLSDYWALYYRMYGCADIGKYSKAYQLCKQVVQFGKKFHVGEYHAAALIHMLVLSTKLEDLNDPSIDVGLNKNKVDGLLSELAYLLPDGAEINIVLNEKIADVIHGSAEELLYSLAFRKYNRAHREKISPFKRLERLCQAALDVVRDSSEADLEQRVKSYRKVLREGAPRITASTPLLKYSARLDPSDFVEGVFDLSNFYGVTPEVFFLFEHSSEAKELFRAFYEGIPETHLR